MNQMTPDSDSPECPEKKNQHMHVAFTMTKMSASK